MSEVTINNETATLGSTNEEFYAVMAWRGVVAAQNLRSAKPTILRYLCKEARSVTISNYVRTFIYYCPATDTWDIHEAKSGIRIEGGPTIADAVKKCIQFFKDTDEKWFFTQLHAMGPHQKYTTVEFDTAMDYLRAGEQEFKRAMAYRDFVERKRANNN